MKNEMRYCWIPMDGDDVDLEPALFDSPEDAANDAETQGIPYLVMSLESYPDGEGYAVAFQPLKVVDGAWVVDEDMDFGIEDDPDA